MTNSEFTDKLIRIAQETKTVYGLGMWGQLISENIIASKTKQLPHWYTESKQKELRALIGTDTFGFDCVCLIKAVLWGWSGSLTAANGGAVYESNGVPDIGTETMIERCSGVTADFSSVALGEAVWMPGHIGIYIGDKLVVECTPIWDNGVQITAVANQGGRSGYHARTWSKHGKLPWVSYETGGSSSGATEGEDTMIGYPAVSGDPLLRTGSKGEAVKNLQLVLMYKFGYQKELQAAGGADGDFGTATQSAVKDFQKVNGLSADGIVGKDTAAALNADLYQELLAARQQDQGAAELQEKLDQIKAIVTA